MTVVAKAELAQSYKAQAMIGFLALVAGIILAPIPWLDPDCADTLGRILR